MCYTMDISDKVKSNFEKSYFINKWEGNLFENSRLPRFISEYLFQYFFDKFNDKDTAIKEFYKFLREKYPEKKEKEHVKHKLLNEKEYTLIDEFSASTDLKHNFYWLNIPSIGINNATVSTDLLNHYPALLSGGMWGLGKLEYNELLYIPEENGVKKGIPVILQEFTPFQPVNIGVEEYVAKREKFTVEEWIDLIIHTVGVNPEIFTFRHKIIFLSRLLPMVENNIYTIEFGERATGKSYIYRNTTSYSRIISGGSVSPALLFYNILTKQSGEIVSRDVIAFDEINKIHFYNPDEVISKLKDYMESGTYERGYMKGKSTCSLVFLGNINKKGENLFNLFPPILRNDIAFIDRISGIVPGWELPKIVDPEKSLSHSYALRSDFFSEIMHKMRSSSYTDKFLEKVELFGNNTNDISIRDWKSITRIASGMMKLIYPNGKIDDDGWVLIASYAVELRNQIVEILHNSLPEEFKNSKILYKIK